MKIGNKITDLDIDLKNVYENKAVYWTKPDLFNDLHELIFANLFMTIYSNENW